MLVGFRIFQVPAWSFSFPGIIFLFLFSILRWVRSHKAKTVVAIVQQAARYIYFHGGSSLSLEEALSPAGTTDAAQLVLYQTYVRY